MGKWKRFPGREIRLEGADKGFRESGDMRHGSGYGGADKPVLGASCQHALRFVDASWRFLGRPDVAFREASRRHSLFQ